MKTRFLSVKGCFSSNFKRINSPACVISTLLKFATQSCPYCCRSVSLTAFARNVVPPSYILTDLVVRRDDRLEPRLLQLPDPVHGCAVEVPPELAVLQEPPLRHALQHPLAGDEEVVLTVGLAGAGRAGRVWRKTNWFDISETRKSTVV